jgi:hypothetical protein
VPQADIKLAGASFAGAAVAILINAAPVAWSSRAWRLIAAASAGLQIARIVARFF